MGLCDNELEIKENKNQIKNKIKLLKTQEHSHAVM